MSNKLTRTYRPYHSPVPLDNSTIQAVSELPKPWPENVTLCIVDTFDGDSTVCLVY
jgi:hypothetical protein